MHSTFTQFLSSECTRLSHSSWALNALDFHTAPELWMHSTFTQLLSSECTRLSHSSWALNVLNFHTAPELCISLDILPPKGRWRQEAVSFRCCFTSTETTRVISDGHFDFHTAPEMLQCCFTSTACRCCWVLPYVHRNRRLIRDGSPGRPPRLSHSSCAMTSTVETIRLIRDGEPRTATATFTQLLSAEKSGNQTSLLSQETAWDAVQVAENRDFRQLCP